MFICIYVVVDARWRTKHVDNFTESSIKPFYSIDQLLLIVCTRSLASSRFLFFLSFQFVSEYVEKCAFVEAYRYAICLTYVNILRLL